MRTRIACTIGIFASTGMAQTTWFVVDDAPNDPGPGDSSTSDPLEDGSAEHPFDAIQEGIDASTTTLEKLKNKGVAGR